MMKLLQMAGNLAGVGGIALCLAAGIARLFGTYSFFGFEMRTVFIIGIALMVSGCLALLFEIRRRLQSQNNA